MTTHHRTCAVAQASADIFQALTSLQREHGLTDVEMLQAVTSWQAQALKHMLRDERHPEDPGEDADEE
jgi:type III secretory pathway component EscS